jgi:hypothetical protein
MVFPHLSIKMTKLHRSCAEWQPHIDCQASLKSNCEIDSHESNQKNLDKPYPQKVKDTWISAIFNSFQCRLDRPFSISLMYMFTIERMEDFIPFLIVEWHTDPFLDIKTFPHVIHKVLHNEQGRRLYFNNILIFSLKG